MDNRAQSREPGQRGDHSSREAPGSDLSSISRGRERTRPDRAAHRTPAIRRSEQAGDARERKLAQRRMRPQGGRCLDLRRRRSVDYGGSTTERGSHEEDISAERTAPQEDARVSGAHEDPGRTEGAEAAAGEGAEAADCLASVTQEEGQPRRTRTAKRLGAGEFEALFRQRGRREEMESFVALWRPSDGPGKVGFAVGRRLGQAVVRNRARRRLREAYRHERREGPAGFDVVFVGRSALLKRSFEELRGDFRRVLGVLSRRSSVSEHGRGGESGG